MPAWQAVLGGFARLRCRMPVNLGKTAASYNRYRSSTLPRVGRQRRRHGESHAWPYDA